MNYLMVDISGKVLNYDIALCEAMSDRIGKDDHLKLLAANIETKNVQCSCGRLISLIPKMLQNSENKIKRSFKALEVIVNYLYLCAFVFCKKPNVLHLQWLPFLEISSIEKYFLRILRFVSPQTKFLLTVHNIYPHDCSDKGKIAYKNRLTKVERYFDKFIVHLQTSKDEFCNKFVINPTRVEVIPHGVFVPKNLKVVPHIRGEKLNLIMYGNQSYYKGTDLLVEAVALLPLESQKKVHTLIVGKISSEYLGQLREKAKGLDIEFIPEFVPDDFLNEKIMESDVIVVPYREISQSGVLLLALNFERMIVASDLPSFKETLFGMGDDVLFKNGDAENLSRLIKIQVENQDANSTVLKKVRLLKHELSWLFVAEKTWNVGKLNDGSSNL